MAKLVKNLPATQRTWVQSLGWKGTLEKGKAPHSSILSWRIPWTIQSTGLQRVRHDGATFTSHASSSPNFRNLPTIFHSDYTNLPSYQQCTGFLFFHILTNLSLSSPWGQPFWQVGGDSSLQFWFAFPWHCDAEPPARYLLAICVSSLENCLSVLLLIS